MTFYGSARRVSHLASMDNKKISTSSKITILRLAHPFVCEEFVFNFVCNGGTEYNANSTYISIYMCDRDCTEPATVRVRAIIPKHSQLSCDRY